jgi:hypothetical protein
MERVNLSSGATVTAAFIAMLFCPVFVQSAQEDAATLYAQAAKAIVVDSPAASNFEFPGYPPFGPDWNRLAQDAWIKNAPARQLAHQAGLCPTANWPKDFKYLNSCRAIANDLGDAALYQHFQGNDAGACDIIFDMLHLSALIREKPADKKAATTISFLVAGGIDDMAASRLMVIDSQIRLIADPVNKTDLQTATAHALIDRLLDQVEPKNQAGEFLNADGTLRALPNAATTLARLLETFNRCNTERTFAAMSLACHLYLLENHHWPDSLGELVPKYMPRIPIDPWGDSKQTLGYALIEPGLPDGSDRPLVYCRFGSTGALSYRTDQPQYGFYNIPGSNTLPAGQFRDVASWVPPVLPTNGPTTRPLE